MKETLKQSFKAVALPQDEASSFGQAPQEEDSVNQLLNEASAFNCNDIQAANFQSQLSFGADNKLEESSLIYTANDYVKR